MYTSSLFSGFAFGKPRRFSVNFSVQQMTLQVTHSRVMQHDGDVTWTSQGKRFINERYNGSESTLYICAIFRRNQ